MDVRAGGTTNSCAANGHGRAIQGLRHQDHLMFCSGHFISYEGDKCERLHGHNYRATVEVEGDLDENAYVFDFIALKRLARTITDELDHRMLLPTQTAHPPGRGAQCPRPLPRARVGVPARRLRAAADREHDGGTAGALRRRPAARRPAREHGFAPEVLRVEVEESAVSRHVRVASRVTSQPLAA
jgi:6-pyruvoyltetrahydropterin/6-carboxytetrahydropterin synthase